MTEYRITTYAPKSKVRFRTEWMDCNVSEAEGIAVELAGLYGEQHVELVMRRMSRAGYEYETLLASEI